MRFIFYLGIILSTILILGMSYSKQPANSHGKNDGSKDSLIGIWKTTNPRSPIRLFCFKKNEPIIVVYQSKFDTDSTDFHAISYTHSTFLGDCLFYYYSNNQTLKYLASYTDHELTIHTSSESYNFRKTNEENLTMSEMESLTNNQSDTLIMFQYRKPEVFEYYQCNDSTLRIKDDIYYPHTQENK